MDCGRPNLGNPSFPGRSGSRRGLSVAHGQAQKSETKCWSRGQEARDNGSASSDCMKLRQMWRSNIWKREIMISLFRRSIRRSNLNEFSDNKRIDGKIRLKDKISLCGELELRNRLLQENHARNCQETEALRRICCEETDRARQLRIDELSLQQEKNPATVSHLLTQIQDLQNKVNSLSDT